jgi:hypothetical protein
MIIPEAKSFAPGMILIPKIPQKAGLEGLQKLKCGAHPGQIRKRII